MNSNIVQRIYGLQFVHCICLSFLLHSQYCKYIKLINRHKPCKTATGHNFKCSHPFSNAHIIFICDISGSMSQSDDGKSKASYKFIVESSKLDNRLGALYSAIHKFINIRLHKGCSDKVSAVMTPGKPTAIAANRVTADENFVKEYLLRFKPTGYENYGKAFKDAETLIDKTEETVVIFLSDGISKDKGASKVTKNLATTMKKKFSLFCVTLGPAANQNNATVKGICTAGGGKMVSTLNGNELGTTFTQIAKEINLGTFVQL